MKINTPSSPSSANTYYEKTPPKAGGKSLSALLNLNKENLPQKQSVFDRTTAITEPSHSFHEPIKVIALRDSIFNANTHKQLNALEIKVNTLNSKEEVQRLQNLIEERRANIT